MATKIADMTSEDLRLLIETLIDRKLEEWFGDPDTGRELRDELRERIILQRKEFAAGKKGRSLQEVAQDLC